MYSSTIFKMLKRQKKVISRKFPVVLDTFQVFYPVVSCEDSSKNGEIIYNKQSLNNGKCRVGTTRTFRCKRKYNLDGHKVSECLPSGTKQLHAVGQVNSPGVHKRIGSIIS